MNIGQAVEALKDGQLLRRGSWEKARKFVFMQVPADINSSIVPKMQSLPQKAKDYFQKTFECEEEQIDAIYYTNQLAEVGLSNLVTAYSPSVSDVLAIDWEIVD